MIVSAALTILSLLLPGIIVLTLVYTKNKPSYEVLLPYVIAFSLAYWIVGFWWLRLVPVSHSLFIWTSISLFLFFLSRTWKTLRVATPSSRIFVIACLSLFGTIAFAYRHTIAPPGHDMSMHAYLAQTIFETNGFPQTLRPLVPIDRFGMYPVGFPVLIATLMRINGLPVYTNALILTILTLWLVSSALATLLTAVYGRFVGITVALLVSWTSAVAVDIAGWGAVPTVLSFAFLVLALFARTHGFFALALFFASLYTHFTLPVTAIFIGISILPLIWNMKNAIHAKQHLAYCVLLGFPIAWHFIFSLPFSISQETLLYVADLQRAELAPWTNAPGVETGIEILLATGAYIQTHYTNTLLVLYAFSLAILSLTHKKHALMHVIASTMLVLIIANSRYWVLPLSPVLYPDRVILFGFIPLGLGIAEGLHTCVAYAKTHVIRHTKLNFALLYTLIAAVLIYAALPHIRITYRKLQTSTNLHVLTGEDVVAMSWIRRHTGLDATIGNSLYDAGTWIPAITGRQITAYHTNPMDADLLKNYAPTPEYYYQGAVSLFKDTSHQEKPDRSGELLYDKNGVKIYSVVQ